jgi:hypothetical protein
LIFRDFPDAEIKYDPEPEPETTQEECIQTISDSIYGNTEEEFVIAEPGEEIMRGSVKDIMEELYAMVAAAGCAAPEPVVHNHYYGVMELEKGKTYVVEVDHVLGAKELSRLYDYLWRRASHIDFLVLDRGMKIAGVENSS